MLRFTRRRRRAVAAAVPGRSSLALTLYIPGSYSASPWAGAASAGTSAGRDLVAFGGSAPAVGASLGGIAPPDFDGTTPQWLWSTPQCVDDFVGTQSNAGTGGSLACLFNADTAVADTTSYLLPALFASHGSSNIVLAFGSAGIRCGINDGVLNEIAPIACTTGATHLVIATFDGTTLKVYLDSAAAVTVATGLPLIGSSPGRELKLGTNYNQTAGFDGRIWTPMAAAEAWSAGQIATIKADINATYGTSFT